MSGPQSLEAAMAEEANLVVQQLERNTAPSLLTLPTSASTHARASTSASGGQIIRPLITPSPGLTTTRTQQRGLMDSVGSSSSPLGSPTDTSHRAGASSFHRPSRRDYLSSSSSIRNTTGSSLGLGGLSKKMSAMAGVFGGKDRKGQNSNSGSGFGNSSSRSPHNRTAQRSHSSDPATHYVRKDGSVVDIKTAALQLSDQNLVKAGGALGDLALKSMMKKVNNGDAGSISSGRPDSDSVSFQSASADVSEQDPETSDDENPRGRSGKGKEKENEETTLGMGRAAGPRTARSLMAAAEEERQEVVRQEARGYSLPRPLIPPSDPADNIPKSTRSRSTRTRVQPYTNFDEWFDDNEISQDRRDGMVKATTLAIRQSAIKSTPATNRCVQILLRGEYEKLVEESEASPPLRRLRTFILATDLSQEAVYATEHIMSVIRDGDTLLAIYCVDEDVGIAGTEAEDDGTKFKAQAADVAASVKVSASTPLLTAVPDSSQAELGSGLGTNSARASPNGRLFNKEESDRHRAIVDISNRFIALLRRTSLQVKVVIEVIHCKKPIDTVLEIIDLIEPTMVVVGSRGRSGLATVTLGSFSSELVGKSSVPVMVARKKLDKKTKLRNPVPHANDLALRGQTLTVTGTLASARIDELAP